jgi:hypothetical protein
MWFTVCRVVLWSSENSMARKRARALIAVGVLVLVAGLLSLVVHESIIMGQRSAGVPRGVDAAQKKGVIESLEDRDRRHAISKMGIMKFVHEFVKRRGNATANQTTTTTAAAAVNAVMSAEPHAVLEVNASAKPTGQVANNKNNSSSVNTTNGRVPPHLDPRSIFVSIASYRDEQCAPTVEDMYKRAKFPMSLYVGIVEQHDAMLGDPKCMTKTIARPDREPGGKCTAVFCPTDNIQAKIINPRDAKGPTFGRYHGMLMYRGEKYYMMIDSHNRFVTNWDAIVVDMYRRLPTTKGVLSHYPEAWNNPEDNLKVTNAPLDHRGTTTYLCTAKFVEHLGFVRLDGFVVPEKKECRPQPWAAAGFLFADSKLLTDVPFDPYLDYVFDGEEILYSVRMWTHGWDIFSPSQNLLYHYYYRTKAKKFWGLLPPGWEKVRDGAQRRIQRLLKTVHKGTLQRQVPDDAKEEVLHKEIDKYGLGTQRTLEQWYDFSGVDKVNYKLTKNFCQKFS